MHTNDAATVLLSSDAWMASCELVLSACYLGQAESE